MKAESLPQMGVADVLAEGPVNGSVGRKGNELGCNPHHAPGSGKGNMGELFIAFFEDPLGVGDEFLIPRDVHGGFLCDLLEDRLEIAGVIKSIAVFPK